MGLACLLVPVSRAGENTSVPPVGAGIGLSHRTDARVNQKLSPKPSNGAASATVVLAQRRSGTHPEKGSNLRRHHDRIFEPFEIVKNIRR